MYNNTKELITRDSLDSYMEMLGDEGVVQDIEGWSLEYPLTLYQTKEYKMYSGHYLKVVFKALQHNLEENVLTQNMDGYVGKYSVRGIDGEEFHIRITEGREENRAIDCRVNGVGHLKEFIEFYFRDLVDRVIMAYKNEYSEKYKTYLWKEIAKVGFKMTSFVFKVYLDPVDSEQITDALMETAEQHIESQYSEEDFTKMTKQFILEQVRRKLYV